METNIQQKVIMVIVGLVLGGLGGFYFGKQQGSLEINKLNKIVNLFVPPMPDEVFNISGEIKSMSTSSKTIDLEINSLQERGLPDTEQKKEIKKLIISSSTEIIRIDFPVFDSSRKPSSYKPSEFEPKEVKISLSDLKVGDTLSVTSEENIKNKEAVSVANIRINGTR